MPVALNMPIDDDLHRRAKVAAASAGVSLKALVERGLELAIAEVEREQGKPKRRK